jgi:hypothetical protein
MLRSLPRPTYANIASTLALIIALGGTGYAVTTIGTDQLRNGAVTSPKIRDAAVTVPKIKDGSVVTGKLGVNAVTGPKIKDASITSQDLAPGAVTSTQLAPGSLRADLFATGQTPGVNPAKIGLQVRTLSIPAGQSESKVIDCPEGTNVISGGYMAPEPVTAGDLSTVPVVTASYPQPPSTPRGYTAWVVRAATGNAAGANILVYAFCVAP